MKNKCPISAQDEQQSDYESCFEPKEGKINVVKMGEKWFEVHKRIGSNVTTMSLTVTELKELYHLIHEVLYENFR